MCDCYCASKNLYKDSEKEYRLHDGGKFNCQRDFDKFYNPHKSNKFTKIFQDTLEMGQITYPVSNQIEELDFQEIIEYPLYFYKEFIAKNKPCKILNAVNDWQALENWSDINYLKEKMDCTNKNKITVDITPDGFADSVHGNYFCQPHQEKMSFQEFLNIEEKHDINTYVPYIQKQNGNLTQEFQFLNDDIDPYLSNFGSQHFFDEQPDAVNFWMGHENTVSSTHKDHYENFYAVMAGEKHFTLSPPEVAPYLGYSNFINGYWKYDSQKGEFYLDTKDTENLENNNNQKLLQWNGLNMDLHEDIQRFPFLKELPKYHTVIKPGEVLYLPAIWFHQVSQAKNKQHGANHDYTIAVNFWYDMQFDQKYRCLQLLQNLIDQDIQSQK